MRLLIECDEEITSLSIEFGDGGVTTKPKVLVKEQDASEANIASDKPKRTRKTKKQSEDISRDENIGEPLDFNDTPIETNIEENIDKPKINLEDREVKVATGMSGQTF
jgi:hypothetical protein